MRTSTIPLEYFYKTGINDKICGYLRYRSDFLSKFDSGADACPSPRSWARASTILSWGLESFEQFESMKGTVGEAAASDFEGYLALYHKMPDPDGVIADPASAEIPEDPALLYALTGALASRANKSNIASIIKYLDRLPNKEFGAFCLKDAYSRNQEIKSEKAFSDWLLSNGKELLR